MSSLHTRALAWNNLRARTGRSAALIVVVAVLIFLLFGGSLLSANLKAGLSSVSARFGADLVVVPLGYDASMKDLLLKGEPSYFYMDREAAEQLTDIPGVEAVSGQFYLTSTGSACCDLPVQIIGFDPDTDFTIQPWITRSWEADAGEATIIVGSDIELETDRTPTLYDKDYTVTAQLEETGTGLDQAVYLPQGELPALMEAASQLGFQFAGSINPDQSLSAVMIRTAEGYDAETVVHNIRVAIDGLQIVETKQMYSGISQQLVRLMTVADTAGILYLAVTVLILSLVFYLIANERKREFAVLRFLGATRGKLARILLTEAAGLSLLGGVLGVLLASVTLLPASAAFSQWLGLPQLWPEVRQVLLIGVGSLACALLIGPVSSLYTVVRICRDDAYSIFREGE